MIGRSRRPNGKRSVALVLTIGTAFGALVTVGAAPAGADSCTTVQIATSPEKLELLTDLIRLDEEMGIIEIARSWFQHYPSDIFISGEVAEIRRQFACIMIRRHKTRMEAK